MRAARSFLSQRYVKNNSITSITLSSILDPVNISIALAPIKNFDYTPICT